MVSINKKLDFKLLKNNDLKINKNSIAYSKKNDRILFELDDDIFKILFDEDKFELEKENSENIFKINNNEASIYLKEHNLLLPVVVEDFNYDNKGNIYTINYQLETDDEQTTIEIIL